jgi:topoisomerase-4 subunit A
VTEEDIVRLTEIQIKRISKFDSFKADEHIRSWRSSSGRGEAEAGRTWWTTRWTTSRN